jgi:hypothetical protein
LQSVIVSEFPGKRSDEERTLKALLPPPLRGEKNRLIMGAASLALVQIVDDVVRERL